MGAIPICGCSTISVADTRCSTIGDLETYQKDTRCRGKWGQQSATGEKSVEVLAQANLV